MKDTLAADHERYIKSTAVTALVSHKTRVSDVASWLPAFGQLNRHEITPAQLQQQIDAWMKERVKAWTVRHRINALRQLYKTLDGEGAYNPVLRVKAPAKPRAIPRAMDYETIYTTLNQMEPSATKAFLMIMASCGFRPSEIKRTEPWMIRLHADEPHVIRNTAKGGDVVVVPLSEVGVLAWQMWLDHNTWNPEHERWSMPSMSNVNRDWKDAMERAGFSKTRCYDLVHSYCTRLLTTGGGDISLVQKVRGHRDIRTTMVYTQVVVDPRLAGAVKKAFSGHARRVAIPRGSDGN